MFEQKTIEIEKLKKFSNNVFSDELTENTLIKLKKSLHIIKNFEGCNYSFADGKILKLFVNSQINRIKDNKIKFCCNIAKTKRSEYIDDVDLLELLNVILNNSTEASERIPNEDLRRISLIIYEDDKFLNIDISNRFLSTDEIKKTDGRGFKCLRKILKKYKGSVEIHDRSDIFKVMISFLLKSNP